MTILTAHVKPPIADRRFDWAAWLAEDESMCQYGPTEDAAIEALYEHIAMFDLNEEKS